MSQTLVCDHCHRWRTECHCHGITIWQRLSLQPVWLQWVIALTFWFSILAIIWLGAVSLAHAQSFTADPAAGISPVKVTLVWDIPGAANCEASGSWSGTKPGKGQLTTSINAAASYTLTCVTPGSGGSATLVWKPPTQNTDDTPLTDLRGYTIVHGLTDTTMDKPLDVGPALTSYTLTDLPAGIHWFGIQAYNSTGTRSARSSASKVIVATPGAQNFAATVSVDVTRQPKPPTELTIAFMPGDTSPPDVPANPTPQAVRNLTPICSDAGSVGKPSCQVPPTHFDFPTASSLVKSDGTWLVFGALGASANVLVCSAEQLPGAIADPYRTLCASDTYLAKSQVPLSAR